MFLYTLLAFLGLMTLFTSAAPAEVVVKRDIVRRQFTPYHHYPHPGYPAPSGYGAPTGTGYAGPTGTGYGYPTGYGHPTSYGVASSSSFVPAPASTSSSVPVPDPCTSSSVAASGTSASFKPLKTSDACPINGVVVCNGESQYGLCNFGHVIFQAVAAGTSCKEGKIVFTGHKRTFNA